MQSQLLALESGPGDDGAVHETFVFDGELPTWPSLEEALRTASSTRWVLREGGRREEGVEKRLFDLDRPQAVRGSIVLRASTLEVEASWELVDELAAAAGELGGRPKDPLHLARQVDGAIDYFSRFDEGSSGFELEIPAANGPQPRRFQIWNGFLHDFSSTNDEVAIAWANFADPQASRQARRAAGGALARALAEGWPPGREEKGMPTSYLRHSSACLKDLGRWLEDNAAATESVVVREL